MLLKEFLQKTSPADRNKDQTDFPQTNNQSDRSSGNRALQPVTVVLGSEAADLDSIVSSLLYAYFLSVTEPETNPAALVQIPRADFRLRSEAVYLFQKAGLDQGLLNFAGDMDLDSLADEGRLRLVLTDHNKLSGTLGHLSENIVSIIDHHADEHQYPISASADIRPVGSACTLVAEKFLDKARDALDRQAGLLLLGTILLDTVNLNPDAGRTADADRKIAEQLVRITGEDTGGDTGEGTGEDREALFAALQFEKCSVAQLSSYDLLRKDYKEWQLGPFRWGISSVMLSAEDWAARDPDLSEAFAQFQRKKNLDVLISMHAFTCPEFRRQLIIYADDRVIGKQLTEFLQRSALGLEKLQHMPGGDENSGDTGGADIKTDSGQLAFYNQKNTAISRKKLHPLMKQFFQQSSEASVRNFF